MNENWTYRYNQFETNSQDEGSDEFDLFMQLSEYDQPIDTDKAWNRFNSKVSSRKKFLPYLIRVAAVLLIGFGISFYIISYQSDSQNSSTQYFATNSPESYVLPDGSEVSLTPHSNVSFIEEGFAGNRNLDLQGEAYFEITKDKSSPFSISSTTGTVTVLGTSFNLNVNEGIDLYVNTGVVEVKTTEDVKQVSKGNRAITLENGTIKVEPYRGINLMSWKTGNFSFENETLNNVIPYLERYYQVKFNVGKNLQNCTITAEFNNMELNEVVKVISTILNAHSKINGKKVTISGSGCD